MIKFILYFVQSKRVIGNMKLFIKINLSIIVVLIAIGCVKQEKFSLVKNGRTFYSILVASSSPESVKQAAGELELYFQKVTGISPKIIVSGESADTPFISLGYTSAARDADLDPSSIPYDGFRIVTKDKNLFILGPDAPTGEIHSLASVNRENQVIEIGSRLEMFVDRQLIDKLEGVELRLHEPQPLPLPKSPLPVLYATVIKDDNLYRAYYRGVDSSYTGTMRSDGNPGELTCYAESKDGHEWTFPNLGLFKVGDSWENNVILAGQPPFSHNFSPFLDTRPGVDKKERFKALAGARSDVYERATGQKGGGLYFFVSPDGIQWRKKNNQPVVQYQKTSPAGETRFDSQNVVFWSEVEQLYVCYFRTLETPYGQLRTISKTTSADFLNWSEPVPMHPNLPGEHLYTSNTHPYFRAPHIYIALPTRFFPDRGSSTDIVFMTTRAGSSKYERLFTEGFIRPGMDPARWGNRSNYVALNVVPTNPKEMSIYHRDGHRYVLRTDGFVSVRAGVRKGELLTKAFVYKGNSLTVNFSTSAAGSLQIELQTEKGIPIPGFELENCSPNIGDEIERTIKWKGNSKLESFEGKPVRLRFVMTECDLYSFQFLNK